jgi:hypothetical protein
MGASSGEPQLFTTPWQHRNLVLELTKRVIFGEVVAPNQGRIVDTSGWLGLINVQWDYKNERAPFLGMFGLPISASFR